MEYVNCATDEQNLIGLHDCRTNHIQYQNQILSFEFPNGFVILDGKKARKSGLARMNCHIPFEDELSIYIYKEINGKIIREDYTNHFIDMINNGTLEFEFVTTYRSYWTLLHKGYVYFNSEPYHYECEIEYHADQIIYEWNEEEER